MNKSTAATALFCGRCNVPVLVSSDADAVHCPMCGEKDTLEGALREASQQMVHNMLRRLLSTRQVETLPKLSFRFTEEPAGFEEPRISIC